MIAKPRGYEYAMGAFRRLAEDYGADRHDELIAYESAPPKWKVVQDMIDHGWDDDEAATAVNKLYDRELGEHYTDPERRRPRSDKNS